MREVLDDDTCEQLAQNIVGHLLNGVGGLALNRTFDYWRNFDENLGASVETGVRAKQQDGGPKSDEQCGVARDLIGSPGDVRLQNWPQSGRSTGAAILFDHSRRRHLETGAEWMDQSRQMSRRSKSPVTACVGRRGTVHILRL